MRASTETLLSIAEWAGIMQLNPWEVGQFGAGFPIPNEAQCQYVFFQQSWPYGFLSREELAATIKSAEESIAAQLGFYPAPQYIEETVEVPYARPVTQDWPFNTFGYTAGYAPLQLKTLRTRSGWVQGGGQRLYTDVGDTAVTYSDPDMDTVNERWTATIATTVTDPDQIGVYFTETDRLGEPLDETWRIRPVRVSISGGVATIMGHSSLMALPRLTLVTDPQVLDVTVTGNFVQTVTIQQVTRDTTATQANPAQGWALWDAIPGDCSEQPCVESATPICISERNMQAGLIAAAYSDPSTCVGWRGPQRVRAKYLAGYPLENGKMARKMADIVAHLATALLPVEQCGCERSSKILHFWKSLPGDMDTEHNMRPLTPKEINSPFGPQRGARYAWEQVQQIMQSGATSL